MSAYAATLTLSGAVAPLSATWFAGEGSRKPALQVWAWPAVLTLLIWGYIVVKAGRDLPSTGAVAKELDNPRPYNPLAARSMWKSKTAVAMLFFFGFQSSQAYVMMGWLPKLMTDRGVPANTASVALAVVGFVGVIGGFIMPTVIARTKNLTPVLLFFTGLFVVAWLCVYFATAAAPILWAAMLGAGGLCFPLALALLTARTRDPLVTARLSGFVQPGGYLLAGAVPLLVGVVYNATHAWGIIILAMVAMSVAQGIIGVGAARNVDIDDELKNAA